MIRPGYPLVSLGAAGERAEMITVGTSPRLRCADSPFPDTNGGEVPSRSPRIVWMVLVGLLACWLINVLAWRIVGPWDGGASREKQSLALKGWPSPRLGLKNRLGAYAIRVPARADF
jgi:hypothetical protein